MVKLKIKELATTRGIPNAYQLAKRMGIDPGTGARIYKGQMKMISLETIDRLCDALDCSPGDLFERKKRKT